MTLSTTGLESRRARLAEEHSGSWASSSQTFASFAMDLFEASADDAARVDGNCAPQALAGVPMLLSALRCFLVELYSGVFTGELQPKQLEALAKPTTTDLALLREEGLPPAIAHRLELLIQVRHEIVHPAHRPGPERDGTPEYLRELKDAGLLQSTGKDTDYVWISQLQSHRLFTWAAETMYLVIDFLINKYRLHHFSAGGLRHTYGRHRPDNPSWP